MFVRIISLHLAAIALAFVPVDAYSAPKPLKAPTSTQDVGAHGGVLAHTRIEIPAAVARIRPGGDFVERNIGAERRVTGGFFSSRSDYVYDRKPAGGPKRPAIVLLHGAHRSGLSMIEMWREIAERRDR